MTQKDATMSLGLAKNILGAGLAIAGINVAVTHDTITGSAMFLMGAAVFLWGISPPIRSMSDAARLALTRDQTGKNSR
jgi:hypothetical protein